MRRRQFLKGAMIAAFAQAPALAATRQRIEVYKNPDCGCCGQWADHLQRNGFAVTIHETRDGAALRAKLGVPDRLASCHTAIVDEYVVEGHVPATDIESLLKERPKARGPAVPGMPAGSPGMEGPRGQTYDVLLIETDGTTRVYRSYRGP